MKGLTPIVAVALSSRRYAKNSYIRAQAACPGQPDWTFLMSAFGRFEKFSEAQKVVIEGPFLPRKPPLA
jgi:hypothetical protein